MKMKESKMKMKKACVMVFLAAVFVAQAETKSSAVSPDGLNEVRLEVGDKGMSYSVWRRGKVLVEPSPVALNTQEHGRLDGKGVVQSVTQRKLEGIVKTPIYKKSQVDLAANETRVDFGEWAVFLVARDDGVAWRFETKFGGELTVVDEDTQYFIPKDATLCYSKVGGFQTGFEQVASCGKPDEVPTGHHDIVLAPMTAVVPDAGVVGMTESNLLDYPGLNFRHTKDEAFLRAAFASEPDPGKVEAFADADDADANAEHYVRREFTVKAGDPIKVRLAPGGGFAARFTPASKASAPYEAEAPDSEATGSDMVTTVLGTQTRRSRNTP